MKGGVEIYRKANFAEFDYAEACTLQDMKVQPLQDKRWQMNS